MNFSNFNIIKKLGSGMYGTTYLIKIDDNEYAMKIQKILPSHVNKNLSIDIWREIDLYNYINKMKPKNQCFFTKLYYYDILDNCEHKQERQYEINKNSIQGKTFALYDNSPYCIRYFLDYHNGITLRKYMQKYTLTIKQKYSMLLQIAKIIWLFYREGYVHSDLHAENIMVSPTTKETFTLFGKKVPYFGIQLSAIDYGMVMNNKFKTYSGLRRYLGKNIYLMTELFYNCLFKLHIINYENLIVDCEKQKKMLPWFQDGMFEEKGIKKIFINYPDFIEKYLDYYVKFFPNSKKLMDELKSQITNNSNLSYVGNENDIYVKFVLERIDMRFALEHPKKWKKIMGWCSEPKFILPKKDILEIMEQNTPRKFINYLLSKI
jgi:serine/threonine protein kinase